MIIEVLQIQHGLIERLQRLLDNLPVSHPKRRFIEADLYKLLRGRSGEKDVAYHLQFWYKDDPDVIVVNNLRLEFNGRSAQIDHLIAVPSGFLVLESKFLPLKVIIEKNGSWYKTKIEKGKEIKEGMYNPAEQNSRHIAVIKDILATIRVEPLPQFSNIVVLTNPQTIVEKRTTSNSFCILRTDQLRSYIDRHKAAPVQKCTPPATELVNEIIKYHIPVDFDVYKRYNIDFREVMPVKERIKYDVVKKMYICSFCSNPMVLKKNKDGLFWGCSNYPLCKNAVPANIAVQVGNETIEEYQRSRSILSIIFGAEPPRICPNCGGTLESKRGRKGEYWECSNKQLCGYKKW